MSDLIFMTGNHIKFTAAHKICAEYGISLEQIALDVPEIQAETGETVAKQKAQDAYHDIQKPLIISDDSWIIPGLNNFPGPYMKSMNHWFTAEDWLRLTSTLQDRRIILRLIVIYKDIQVEKLFTADIEGIILYETKGEGIFPHTAIISFNGGKTSLAEDIQQHQTVADVPHSPWRAFSKWYKANKL